MSDRLVRVALPAGYSMLPGSTLDRALLLKFMHKTYLELTPDNSLTHLSNTVEQYFSSETPIWWVAWEDMVIACLWLGTAIDQLQGDRHAHIFLLYVAPAHRRKGIGSALMHQAEAWAQARGDRQIGLQVFQSNQPALSLYQQLGYEPQSLWMVKPLNQSTL
ncbi:MAG: GNAT family N-acetyltransferase [Oscillatoriales cyanobacterium C42_A2020_001]|nr:GNAT family N-acetyltransferase [Leptolyngbyaceae cyanobacterium C42_A2020_001]